MTHKIPGNQLGTRARSELIGCVVLMAALLLVAGCSRGSRGRPPIASLPGSHASTGTGPLTQAQSDQAMVGFSRCMRAHGVAMSDPFHQPGHQGLTIDLPTRSTANGAGYRACEYLIAPIMQAKQAGAARQATAELPQLIAFARCMRSHGIAMLDPNAQGVLSLGTVPGISGDYGRYSPQFRTADEVCRHFLPADVRDDGTGP